jgi:hypothetical protein
VLHDHHISRLCAAPQDVRLIQRLRQVCKQEGLHVGNSAFIAELCSATGHDIRASINNLQFAALKTSKQQQVAAESTGAASAGAWGSAFGQKPAKPGMFCKTVHIRFCDWWDCATLDSCL